MAVTLAYIKEMETLASKRQEFAKAKGPALVQPPKIPEAKSEAVLSKKQLRAELWAERRAAAAAAQ